MTTAKLTEWEVPLDYGETYTDKLLIEHGLQYIVNTEPCLFDGEPTGEDFWTYRVWPDGTREPIKPVGKDYQPIQNRTAFDFLNVLGAEGELEVTKIQDYRRGKAMLLNAKLPDPIYIAGEPITRKFTFINGHDGHMIYGAMVLPERDWCTNKLPLQEKILHDHADGKIKRVHKIKHTSGAPGRISSVLTAIQESERYFQALRGYGEELASKRVKTRDFERFVKRLVKLDQKKPGRGETLALKRADEIRAVWRESDNLNDIRFTKWGFLQAVVEWNDHNRNYSDENVRFDAVFRGRTLYSAADRILRGDR